MIGVIDYKAGNGPSVINALKHIGEDCILTGNHEELLQCNGIILPGVGSADATMASLKEKKILSTLETMVLEKSIPFLGICVGMQILFEHSEEGDTPCLGWIQGKVKKFPESVRVPQIGWNKVRFTRADKMVQHEHEDYYYFVNSYYVEPSDDEAVLGVTEYGIEFCSMVAKKNIMATQFHAEKSGEAGFHLLRNFASILREGM